MQFLHSSRPRNKSKQRPAFDSSDNESWLACSNPRSSSWYQSGQALSESRQKTDEGCLKTGYQKPKGSEFDVRVRPGGLRRFTLWVPRPPQFVSDSDLFCSSLLVEAFGQQNLWLNAIHIVIPYPSAYNFNQNSQFKNRSKVSYGVLFVLWDHAHLNPLFPEFVGAFHIVSCVLLDERKKHTPVLPSLVPRFVGFLGASGSLYIYIYILYVCIYIYVQHIKLVFKDTFGVFGAKRKPNPSNIHTYREFSIQSNRIQNMSTMTHKKESLISLIPGLKEKQQYGEYWGIEKDFFIVSPMFIILSLSRMRRASKQYPMNCCDPHLQHVRSTVGNSLYIVQKNQELKIGSWDSMHAGATVLHVPTNHEVIQSPSIADFSVSVTGKQAFKWWGTQ